MAPARYSETQINARDLKSNLEKLRQCDNGQLKSKLEEEFEKIVNASEEQKSSSVGNGDNSNASFIEGYDKTKSFIITQDPTKETVCNFWRMILEQGIDVIIMLSEEFGVNRCYRYWPETYHWSCDHIHVRCETILTCPYYTNQEMFVKTQETEERRVTRLRYLRWPIDPKVPEDTRGLIVLVDLAKSYLDKNDRDGCPPPMLVHCYLGTNRSSMFVALYILVQQLRAEGQVDVFAVVKKLRSQRQGLINSYAQYEFLYRAIADYAELHELDK